MNITEDQAKEVLYPYQQSIRECIVSAWKDYHNNCRDFKHLLAKRSRASIIFDFIVHNIRQKFEGQRNIYLSNQRGIFLVNFNNKVIVRFKKLKHNRASCIPTQQTLDFFGQVELPDIPKPDRFVVGYQLNHMQTEIRNISVVYPQSTNQNYWVYDLEPIEATVLAYQNKQTSLEHEATKEERIVLKNDIGMDKAENEQGSK